MKASQVIDAIREFHEIYFVEFRVESGLGYLSEKRIDLFAINCYPSKRLERTAYEVNNPRLKVVGL